MLQLLSELHRVADFTAYVRNTKLKSKPDKFLVGYEREYRPWDRADILVEVEHDG